jgi:hypothetical protein
MTDMERKHLAEADRHDEPEILPSSTHPICLTSADGGQFLYTGIYQVLRS